jgi:uncharacterized membrane protein (UPF0127 family)
MNFQRIAAVLFLSLCLLPGCGRKPQVAPVVSASRIDPVHGHLLQVQPKLPTIKVWLADQELIAEVATHAVEIATGMMFRTNMLENEAMLFVFPNAAPRSFYMRNCFVPLSGAYISPSGEILQIIDMKPHDETGIPSHSDNVQFVLEVPQGWFKRHHVGVGAIVRTERGSLQETFLQRR